LIENAAGNFPSETVQPLPEKEKAQAPSTIEAATVTMPHPAGVAAQY